MQISIINGIYSDQNSDLRTSYPKNMVPVPKQNGVSAGYLRPAEGIETFATGPGEDRGGINWNGACYRVMGPYLCKVASNGTVTTLGNVGPGDQVTLDYSFDRLAVASAGSLYYYNGVSVSQVTDADLGTVKDVLWVDGYFMTTDGQYLIVTELTDPSQVNPLKYGSSEVDPDPVVGLLKLRNEVYALNRYTVEAFQNVGGEFFPFERIEGAQMQRGAIGTHAMAVYMEAIAFLGGGRNEAPAVWLGLNGQTHKLSTREIEQILKGYGESVLADVLMETRLVDAHQFLYLHLPDKTLVYDGAASAALESPVWFVLTSGAIFDAQYRAKNFVYAYDKWLVGDPASTNVGVMVSDKSSHYGNVVGWSFGTNIAYNESRGAVFHDIELVALTGNAKFGDDPTIWTSYSKDGKNWSAEMPRQAGKWGETQKRINWLQQGTMRNFRIQRFRGTSDCHMSFLRLEARVEALNV